MPADEDCPTCTPFWNSRNAALHCAAAPWVQPNVTVVSVFARMPRPAGAAGRLRHGPPCGAATKERPWTLSRLAVHTNAAASSPAARRRTRIHDLLLWGVRRSGDNQLAQSIHAVTELST